MAHLIDKSALLAEIKERIETYNKGYANGDDSRADALEVLLHDIDSMQEEPVSKDLDEAVDCYKDTVTPEEVDDFEHAYSYETYTEYQIADAFKAGALWQREKMLKDAVEAHAFPADNEFLCDFSKIPYFDTWEKVKLIVVKED